MKLISEDQNLIIGENYTRGELSDYMGIKYQKDFIEKGLYHPPGYSSILVFSTIHNKWNYKNGKHSDNIFIYQMTGNPLMEFLNGSKKFDYELESVLFIRLFEETGFYYFGRCVYFGKYKFSKIGHPLIGLKLIDTAFSKVKEIIIPTIEKTW